MNIGINASFIDLKSGIATYTHNLIKNLQEHNNNNDKYSFFLSKHSVIPDFFDEKQHDVCRSDVPRYNSLKKTLWEQLLLPGEIHRKKLNLFHSPAFIAPINLKTPSIVTIHDLTFLKFPETITGHKRMFYNFMIKRSIENASHIIVDSNSVRNDLIESLDIQEEKVTTIYLGIDEIYQPETDNNRISELLEEYNIDRPFFLFVGVIEPRKNIKRILEAFSILDRKDTLLVIAGKKGWMYNEVFESIKKSGLNDRVIFTGEVSNDQLRILYSSCLSLVFPSLYEGFGLPVIEAMACGAPVITSDCSSIPEVAGGAALLVDPMKPEEIAASMSKLYENSELRKELSQKGMARAAEFSWKRCALETNQIYHKICT